MDVIDLSEESLLREQISLDEWKQHPNARHDAWTLIITDDINAESQAWIALAIQNNCRCVRSVDIETARRVAILTEALLRAEE